MPTDSETNDILSLDVMHYTTAVSLEMSDEPFSFAITTPYYTEYSYIEPFFNRLQDYRITGLQSHCSYLAPWVY